MVVGAGRNPIMFLGIFILALFARGPFSFGHEGHASGRTDSTRGQLNSAASGLRLAQTPSVADAVLVGAGDIADCADLSGAEATAKLLDGMPGTVFTAGDNAY
jgi:hypothetical protein